MDCSEIRWRKRYRCLLAIVSNARKRLPSKRYFFSHDNSCATAQECVDRTTFKATIRDEDREAAPRPRNCGVLNRTHTRASSLAKMSAGITNPCGYIDQPARARPCRMVTAGRSRLACGGTTITLLLRDSLSSQPPRLPKFNLGTASPTRCTNYSVPARFPILPYILYTGF